MAQGVRSRPLGPGTARLHAFSRDSCWAALCALAAACGGEAQGPPPPIPRAVDVGKIADADLVAAVLDECHRPLEGTLDRLAATVRLPDGAEVRLFAELPDKLRVATAAERLLLVDGAVHRLEGDAASPATPAQRERVQRLRTLLDGAALGPLHRATGCRRLGPAEFELAQPSGEPWRLRLRAGTLLPDRLAGPEGTVQVLDWLRTSTTWIVKRAEVAGLGACELRFDLAGLDWSDDFFAVARPTPTPDRTPAMRVPGSPGVEPRSPVPFLADGKATRWVVLDDPGPWCERATAYRPVHTELERQQQQVAGFPMFFTERERAMLAAPFRQRQGGPAFAPPAGWTIRDVPAGRWLVVYPPDGDLDARIGTGAQLLRDALAQKDLAAAGPIVVQPFFHLHEGEPAADKLNSPTVRMSVPVR